MAAVGRGVCPLRCELKGFYQMTTWVRSLSSSSSTELRH